jgi:hypothetical protein
VRLEWAALDWDAPAIGFYERFGVVGLREWNGPTLVPREVQVARLRLATEVG